MQRAAGNRHTSLAIARSRAAGHGAPSPDAALGTLDRAPGAAEQAAPPPGVVHRSVTAGSAPPGPVVQRGVLDTLGGAWDTVSDAASGAVDAVSGAIDRGIGVLRGAVTAIVGQITRVWDTVKRGVTGAVEAAGREASGLLGGIASLFGATGAALGALDGDALGNTWAAITSAAGAALAGVRGIVTRVTATVDQLWAGLRGMADGLIGGVRRQAEAVIGRLPGVAQGPARALWSTIEGSLTRTWRRIEAEWSALRGSALRGVNQVVERVEGVVTSIRTSVVATIVGTLRQVKGLFEFVKRAIANPEALIAPMVQEISARLQGLPARANSEVQSRAQEQAAAGSGARAPAAAGASPNAAIQRSTDRVVQRDAAPAAHPRSTLGLGQVLSGCSDFISDKLAKLWANLGGTVKEMVLSMVWPPATWAGLKQDWQQMTTELSTRVSRIESIRTDSWGGFWEDLRRWLSNMADFPLIIWRAANAMLGRLSVYIGLAIILGGAAAGAIAAGTGGAVFGSVVPGAGTAAGGGVGIAAGAWAGAQAGYAAAQGVGLALLVSFAGAEQLSIVKALNDLLWVPQSAEEQSEDFDQATNSVIAIATALLLMAIAFIGVALARRVWAFVKNIPGRFRPKPVEGGPTPPKPVDGDPAQPRPGEPSPGTPDRLVICRVCDTVPGVPADLMAERAALSPEARARLDKTAGAIFRRDPANPTPKEFDNLRSFMEAKKREGGGSLEVGLQKLIADDARKNAPPPPEPAKPPFGPKAGELPAVRTKLEATIAEIEDFARANPDKNTITTSADSLRSVGDGPLTEMEKGAVEASEYLVNRVNGSITGAEGELHAARRAPSQTLFGQKVDGIEIDQIRPDGTYYEIKNQEPFGRGDVNAPTTEFTKVKNQLSERLRLAQKYPVDGRPRAVVMEFPKGVDKDVAAALRAVELNGQRATIVGTEVTVNP